MVSKCNKAPVSGVIIHTYKDAFKTQNHFFSLSLKRRKVSKKNIRYCIYHSEESKHKKYGNTHNDYLEVQD